VLDVIGHGGNGRPLLLNRPGFAGGWLA
jgi:hypothetical protein